MAREARLPREIRPQPATIRSRVVLEIAAELVAMKDQPNSQAKVLLRPQGESDWPLALSGSSTIAGIDEVVKGEAALAIVNPSSALNVACRGNPPFTEPQPVLPIAVIPSLDLCLFVVSSDTGLTYVEDIAAQRTPLHVALRGQPDHWLQQTFEDICACAGFTLEDLESWGGSYRREGGIPNVTGPKFKAMADGEINAIFDESAFNWGNDAIPAGMTVLNMKEETIRKLEEIGHIRHTARKEDFPTFPGDISTVDFSGWPVFVHAEAPDELVTQICAAFEARKHLIPWQFPGPLPLERMCRDCEDAPLTVPLHRAAERYWREIGYLD
jgi:TRAP-type uncharacterized transport system substrate-binding protein